MVAKRKRRLLLVLVGGLALVILGLILMMQLTRLYFPIKYADSVESYSKTFQVPKELIYAVIHTESRFTPDAVSSVGAQGLMQLTEETFEWLKWKLQEDEAVYADMFDPDTNIRYGTYLLSVLLEEFKSPETALAAYHAGRGIVNRWLGDGTHSADGKRLSSIPYKDTAGYVPKVTRVRRIYLALYPNTF